METSTWTIAYRKPRANKFHRVTDWSGTWREAYEMANRFAKLYPGMQVYYVSTLSAEEAGDVVPEDRGNVMVDSGKRIQMTETGKLPRELAA
jgi:hypothetical protein